MRRYSAGLLAVLVLWLSVAMPARAFVVAAPFVLTGSGTAIQVVSGSIASLVGALAMAFTIANDNGDEVRLPVSDQAGAQAAMPAPAAAQTVAVQVSYTWNGSTNAQAACEAVYNQWNAPGSYCAVNGYGCAVRDSETVAGAGLTCTYRTTLPGGGTTSYTDTYSINGVSTGGCPAGYGYASNQCTLVNARQATPDKKCDLQFSGTGAGSKYMYYDDADCPGGPTIDNGQFVPGLRNDGKTAFISGTDSAGRPILVEVQVSDDGTKTYVRHYTQDTQGGNSVVQETQLTVDRATSRVTNASTQTNPGTISQPGTSTVPTTTPTAPTAADTPTVQRDPEKVQAVETCGLPGKPACAVDDEGFTGKDTGVTDKVTQGKADIDAEYAKLLNPTLPTFDQSWLPSLLPGNAVACQPIPLTIGIGHGWLAGFVSAHELDLCPHFDVVRQILGWLFGLATLVYLWRLAARDGEG